VRHTSYIPASHRTQNRSRVEVGATPDRVFRPIHREIGKAACKSPQAVLVLPPSVAAYQPREKNPSTNPVCWAFVNVIGSISPKFAYDACTSSDRRSRRT